MYVSPAHYKVPVTQYLVDIYMNEAEDGHRNGMTLTVLVCLHLPRLGAVKFPIAVCPPTASPEIRVKWTQEHEEKGELMQNLMFGGLGRIHGLGPL